MTSRFTCLLLLGAVALLPAGCRDATLFRSVDPGHSGVRFANTLSSPDDFNILNYLYYYDGGGVAAGDVDNDGLVDLYFVANEGPNRLYLNRGNLRFDDVTEQAGVAGSADWNTGVTMADLDGDGFLDIYVSALSGYEGRSGRNELFINNGDGTFTERAAAFGLDFAGYGTQAAFFDYDRDGDLDVYLLNHSTHVEETYGRGELRLERHPRAGDRLLRNDGGRFNDVSEEAGIYGGRTGYGLGVSVSDVNLDGCADIYVANDFHEHDYLYLNQCDGTFEESIRAVTGHTSRASMGSDAADVNNDGYPDIVVLDMLPRRDDIRKTAAGADPIEIEEQKLRFDYHHQVPRNTLLLNLGGRRFADIALYAGIEATDWSWSPLLADLDNDGWKDLFVTNGILRRPNDLDYIASVSQPQMQRALAESLDAVRNDVIQQMPQVAIPNEAFRNRGDMTFERVAWGLDENLFSNGASYADLDNDGDLDLVLNNIDATASIYENRSELGGRHWLTLVLRGDGLNTRGIGARVTLISAGLTQVQELMPTRGFQSSVDHRLHFGLGETERIDSIVVVWPDGRTQTLADLSVDTSLTLSQAEASSRYVHSAPAGTLFADLTVDAPYEHRENRFFDYTMEPLLPHMLSTEGPALAVGDVNGDGLDDLWLGSSKQVPSALLVQQAGGSFVRSDESVWQSDSLYEDVDAAFFDADGDSDLDLYVVTAGNEFWGEAEALRDRLYLNDGSGSFHRAADALPDVFENGSVVRPFDFDLDGDLDLFVGSRVVTRDYGASPRSVLLRNDGRGRFEDVTDDLAPGLATAGMITDAVWTDITSDGRPDLVVVGEWTAVQLYEQSGGVFAERDAGLSDLTGWWSSVHAADLDGDGDDDLVLGNLGLNSHLRASGVAPVRLYLKDFDASGTTDEVLTVMRENREIVFAGRDKLLAGMPSLAKRYPTYASLGTGEVSSLFSASDLDEARVLTAHTFASTVAVNRGGGMYELHNLPAAAQLSPVRAILSGDYDEDGVVDLILAGNFFNVDPEFGRYDAGQGLFLKGTGDAFFRALWPHESGLEIDGQVRKLGLVGMPGGIQAIVAARNDESPHFILVNSSHLLARR